MDKLKQTIERLKHIQMDGAWHPCPRCGRAGSVSTRTALSRSADVFVCDQCGTDEALRAMKGNPLPLADWNFASALSELPEDTGECPLGGDPANDCAGCAYSGDYHYVAGECLRREDD